ncbi:cytochrome b/b6 domain-containing protein [Yoonia sp. R2-816]|uniref:cytochrome b/b6 domain-containing protein n=1 Tax=Yoonia sp. R2-816 TaxID=3342638 RepID=UPI00372A4EC1
MGTGFARFTHLLPHRRTWLKVSHAAMIPLLIWFIFVTPDDVLPFGPAAFRFHSVLALVFVTICLIWTVDYLRRGLAGRPGPKLGPRARRFHVILHKTIILGLAGVALTGFLLGLTSSKLLKAGGFLPIAPPMNWPDANEIAGTIHIYEFYILGAIVVVHAGFHIWRHVRLRDNALRIMAPKLLHRFL